MKKSRIIIVLLIAVLLIVGIIIFNKKGIENQDLSTVKPEEVGLNKASFDLIDEFIKSDIDNGFTSAQLAVIKDGKFVYQNSWGYTNSYNPDGTRIENGTKVTNDTMYDLASNTKMYSVVYSIQYMIDQGQISLNDKVTDILGSDFVDKTIEINFDAYKGNYPGLDKIKEWKSNMTIKDLLTHMSGFPDSGHYHNDKFDIPNQSLSNDVDNILYAGNESKQKTLEEGLNKTPPMHELGEDIYYSDINYMLLGLIIEKKTGKDLNTYLKETFWKPMGLTRITYNPLDNGFVKDDCAATELNGNTRDGLINFPKIRTKTIQGEVHDEEAYYTMEGMSGHAGLFANATDLAKLCTLMLDGTYKGKTYFTKETIDEFIAPVREDNIHYGLGWWRQGENQKRKKYFSTMAPASTIGHQGWTGTLTMIDYENNMVVVFLTNSINTPIYNAKSLENANDFAGKYYATSSLGFINQMIYTGLNKPNENISEELKQILVEMQKSKEDEIAKQEEKTGDKLPKDHPLLKAKATIDKIINK